MTMNLVVPLMITFISIIFGFMFFTRWEKYGVKSKKAPKVAGSWPILGHLPLLAGSDQVVHKLYGSMADKYGPIFSLKLGASQAIVVSNSEMAKECLTTNDKVFASRPKSIAFELISYNFANSALGPYNQYWRDMRKITSLILASQQRSSHQMRVYNEVTLLSMREMHTSWKSRNNEGSSDRVKIDMTQWFDNLIVNMTLRMMFGKRFLLGEKGDQFKISIRKFEELFGAVVPADVVSGLRWLDLGGLEKKMKKTVKEMDITMDRLLDEHKHKTVDDKDQVFMTALLSRVKDELKEDTHGFSMDTIVKATCLSILTGATNTRTFTLIWALALLVNNPLVLLKAQQEIDNHVGRDRRIHESDLKNFAYLQAIIKETMRLYPVAPLSLPHESTEDCIVGGYIVPKKTQLFVNISKIQNDPQMWTDPSEFKPERFLTEESKIKVKDQYMNYLPFGCGRRMCPGASVALESMLLILANIIHGFEFNNLSNEQVDMTEAQEWLSQKATPLELLVAPRLSPDLYGELA
ncbi:demethylepipodophyllotoxin synthase-like [Rutidosis leptorrhynchoides]|uniref:demethylepipodophyllotoxin synthase-like n=1 Tax=Rutidosis leptorrhynchoides TaxID=125765 RepID=UPI003A99C03F